MPKVTYRGSFPFCVKQSVPVWDKTTFDHDAAVYLDPDSPTDFVQQWYPAMSVDGELTRLVCGDGTHYPLNLGPNLEDAVKFFWRVKGMDCDFVLPTRSSDGTLLSQLDNNITIERGTTEKDLECQPSNFVTSVEDGDPFGWGSNPSAVGSASPFSFGDIVKGSDGNYYSAFDFLPPYYYNYFVISIFPGKVYGSDCSFVTYFALNGSPNTPPVILRVAEVDITGLPYTSSVGVYSVTNPLSPTVGIFDSAGYYPVGSINFNSYYTYEGIYDPSTGDPV